jgi:predicted nucleic acid-binding protein
MPKIAIVDASFWIHLVKIDLLNIFLEYYTYLYVPLKVESEITFADSLKFKLFTPSDIKLYYKLKKEKVIIIKDPTIIKKELKSQVSNNSGELYCIALSQELGVITFIDNGRPYKYCKEHNILVGNIIEFMLFLYSNKKLTKKEVLSKIVLIQNSLPQDYLKSINNYLKGEIKHG